MRYLSIILIALFFIQACGSEENSEENTTAIVEGEIEQDSISKEFLFKVEVTKKGQEEYAAVLTAPRGQLQIYDEKKGFQTLEKDGEAYLITERLPQLGRIMLSQEEQVLLVLKEGTIKGEKQGEKITVNGPGENHNLQFFNELYTGFTKKQQELLAQINAKGNINQSPVLQKEYSQKLAEIDIDFENELKLFNDTITPSFVGMLSASRLFKDSNMNYLEEVMELYGADKDKYFYAQEMVKEYQRRKATSIGFKAPDFTLKKPDGTSFKLSSLRGGIVLIDFWASWCGPCRKENPNVLRVYNAYKDKGFDIISVSLDKDPAQWKMAIQKDGLTWNHVWDKENEVAGIYSVNSIPYTLLLNKKGEIIAKNLRGPELERKLKEVL